MNISRFTEDQIRAILTDTRPVQAIANHYSVNYRQIARIRSGKRYGRCCPDIDRALVRVTRKRLDKQAVLAIAADPRSQPVIAREYQTNRHTVGRIKNGKAYRHLFLPHLSCQQCQHWLHNACSFGFPDPTEIGPQFANECSNFTASDIPDARLSSQVSATDTNRSIV